MNMRWLLVYSTFLMVSCTPEPSDSSKSLAINPELEAINQSQVDKQVRLEAELLNASDLSEIALLDELSQKATIEMAEIEDSLLIKAKLRDEEEAKLLEEAARLKQDKLPPPTF